MSTVDEILELKTSESMNFALTYCEIPDMFPFVTQAQSFPCRQRLSAVWDPPATSKELGSRTYEIRP